MTTTVEITKAITTLQTKLPEYTIPTMVATMEQYADASDLAGKIKKAIKIIEDKRDFYATPHYKVYKDIREKFAPFLALLESKEKEIKNVMTVFYIAEKQRKDKEQAALEKAALKAAKDGVPVEVVVINNIATVETINTKVQMRTLIKWRVTDETKIARKYLTIDTKAVDAAIKAGTVPQGIETYEELSPAITT